MTEPSLPKRSAIEEPLLKEIIRLGGSIIFSKQGRHLETVLATEFGLSDEVRDFQAPNYHSKGHRKWRNHIQFVRDDLAKKRQINDSVDDIWSVTDLGYERLGISKTQKLESKI